MAIGARAVLCGPCAIGCARRGAEVLALWQDPSGDDTGDGDVHVSDEHRLRHGRRGGHPLVQRSGRTNGDLIFTFKMRRLVDPWQVGNRLTMVAVAIDTDEGGDAELRRNANVRLGRPSEYQVFAGGETVEVTGAGSERVDIGATVKTDIARGYHRILVPIAGIDGAASDWRFTAVAGLQDDYGAGGLGRLPRCQGEGGGVAGRRRQRSRDRPERLRHRRPERRRRCSGSSAAGSGRRRRSCRRVRPRVGEVRGAARRSRSSE